MYTLGINAAYHDPAACLIRDGQVIAAAEEERFTQIKHGKRPIPFSAYELPYHAIDYCLPDAGVSLGDVAHVSYSHAPHPLLPPRAPSPCYRLWPRGAGHLAGGRRPRRIFVRAEPVRRRQRGG